MILQKVNMRVRIFGKAAYNSTRSTLTPQGSVASSNVS